VKIEGIIPALHTAFDDRGQFDAGRQAHLVERLIAQGVHGLFAGGSTGEFPLLSADERERLAAVVIEAARGRVPVVVHAGAAETAEAARLARRARRDGAAAVSCLPPYYYRLRIEEILDHYRAAAEAAAPLPFYAYHIPELTGVPMNRPMLEGLAAIPNFAGLKWSDPDLFGLRQAVEALDGRADVLSGRDETLFPALTLGARGAIGSTYNFLAPWFVQLWNGFRGEDLAAACSWQARANRVIAVVLDQDGALSTGKAATRWAGMDCGEPRPPLRRLTPADRRGLEERLAAAGLPQGGIPPAA